MNHSPSRPVSAIDSVALARGALWSCFTKEKLSQSKSHHYRERESERERERASERGPGSDNRTCACYCTFLDDHRWFTDGCGGKGTWGSAMDQDGPSGINDPKVISPFMLWRSTFFAILDVVDALPKAMSTFSLTFLLQDPNYDSDA